MRDQAILYLAVFALLAAAALSFLGVGTAMSAHAAERAEHGRKVKRLQREGRLSRAMRRLIDRCAGLVAASRMPMPVYAAFTVLCAVAGYTAGKIVFNSTVIALAVGTIGMIGPLLFFSFRQNKARTARLERLAASMSVLSNSYIVTEDIITSVQEDLELLDYPEPFREFLTYVTMMDSSVETGLRRMERQVGNSYMSQWVDALVLAQDDRSLKYATVAVVQSMHDMLSAHAESDAAMYSVWRDYLTTLVLIFSVPLIFRITLPDAYTTLTTSTGGQALFVLLLVAVAWSVFQALKINRPLIV